MSKYIGRPETRLKKETLVGGAKTWVAFGANLVSEFGPPLQSMRAALDDLISLHINPKSFSKLYQTPCFPAGAGPDYLNFVAEVETSLAAPELLHALHAIEEKYGRKRETRWAGRTLDIDILAVDDQVLPDVSAVQAWIDLPLQSQLKEAPAELLLPHPRLQDRAFVLIPFADVAPDWRHPILQKTVAEMLEALPESAKKGVEALDEGILGAPEGD